MSSYKKLASIDTARRRLLFHIGTRNTSAATSSCSSTRTPLDKRQALVKDAIGAKLAPSPAGDSRALFRAAIKDAPLSAAAPDRVKLA